MYWITVQLSSYAKRELSVKHLESVVKNNIKQEPVLIYIPVSEDYYGKQDSGYGEYLFINYVEGVNYFILEDLDEFLRILKKPHGYEPSLISDLQLDKIRGQVEKETRIVKGDVVKIIKGNVKGNYGVVQSVNIQYSNASIQVKVGQESLFVNIPIYCLRKSRRLSLNSTTDVKISLLEDEVERNPIIFSNKPKIEVLKKGFKKTKLLIDGKVSLVLNDDLDEIMDSHGFSEEMLVNRPEPETRKIFVGDEADEPDYDPGF